MNAASFFHSFVPISSVLFHPMYFLSRLNTGGPDGDVAGNEIKILFREYGDNVKIVGIADGSGCAEDPDGLDHEEVRKNF